MKVEYKTRYSYFFVTTTSFPLLGTSKPNFTKINLVKYLN